MRMFWTALWMNQRVDSTPSPIPQTNLDSACLEKCITSRSKENRSGLDVRPKMTCASTYPGSRNTTPHFIMKMKLSSLKTHRQRTVRSWADNRFILEDAIHSNQGTRLGFLKVCWRMSSSPKPCIGCFERFRPF